LQAVEANAGWRILSQSAIYSFAPDDLKQACELCGVHIFELAPVETAAGYTRLPLVDRAYLLKGGLLSGCAHLVNLPGEARAPPRLRSSLAERDVA
jgi:hypothetical protein